jgi:hypothetical protein
MGYFTTAAAGGRPTAWVERHHSFELDDFRDRWGIVFNDGSEAPKRNGDRKAPFSRRAKRAAESPVLPPSEARVCREKGVGG